MLHGVEPPLVNEAAVGAEERPPPRRRPGPSFVRAFRVYSRIFIGMFFLLFVPLQLARTDRERDAIAYYGAQLRVEQGESLYTPYPPNRAHDPKDGYPFYLYPPPFAAALSLLPALEWAWFARVMFIACVAGFWAFAAGIGRLATGRISWDATMIAGAAVFLWPGMNAALQSANVDLLLLPAAAWAVAAARPRGALLAAVAAVKTFGFWPLVGWTLRRPRTALASAAIGTMLLAGATVAALGPARTARSSLEWAEHVAPVLGQGQFESGAVSVGLPEAERRPSFSILPGNLSIPFAPVALAARVGWIDPSATLPRPVRVYLLLCATLAPVLAIVLTRRLDADLQTAIVLAAAVLFGPLTRPVYLAYALPAAVLAWRSWRAGRPRPAT